MERKDVLSSPPTIAPEAMRQFGIRHEAIEQDFEFSLASLNVPVADAEVMRGIFASIVAMGAARLLDLGVPVNEVVALADEVIDATNEALAGTPKESQ